MDAFFRAAESLSGQSCNGLTVKEVCEQIVLYCPEFYDNPQACLTSLMNALPEPNSAWKFAFVALFIFSDFANRQSLRSVCATQDSVPASLVEKATYVSGNIPPRDQEA